MSALFRSCHFGSQSFTVKLTNTEGLKYVSIRSDSRLYTYHPGGK